MADLNFTKAESILPDSLLSVMDIDITVNEALEVIVLHDTTFPFPVDHLEFHRATGDLYFGGADGAIRHFGMPVPQRTRGKLATATDVYLVMVEMRPERRVVAHNHVSLTQKD